MGNPQTVEKIDMITLAARPIKILEVDDTLLADEIYGLDFPLVNDFGVAPNQTRVLVNPWDHLQNFQNMRPAVAVPAARSDQ